MPIIIPTPKERSLFFSTNVNGETIGTLSKSIIEINNDDDLIRNIVKSSGFEYTPNPIKIYIDSRGGEVHPCLGLIGVIENSNTPIHTIVTGCAMSAGFLISISGHKRYAYKLSTMLYHQISSWLGGTQKDLEDNLFETSKLQKIIEKHTLKCTKLTEKQLKDSFEKKKDLYFSSKEALRLGIIDEIVCQD